MCQHVGKSVSLADIKRQLKSGRRIGLCDKKVPTPCSSPADKDKEVSRARLPDGVWMCLQCGHQGCAAHATQHVDTPRSDSHVLALDTLAGGVWCFTCSQDVSLKANKKLHEAVQFVQKKREASHPGEATTPKQDTSATPSSSKNSKGKPNSSKGISSLPKTKGLINLGNSCYLNSVLQCISHCDYLTHYLELSSRPDRRAFVTEDGRQLELVLREPGPLTAALLHFLKEMHTAGTSASLSPSALLKQISQRVPQFEGTEQQDAHELLRALIEHLRHEELRRHQREILRALEVPSRTDPRHLSDELKQRAKELGRQVAHTTVDTVFCGQLISLVVCETCGARTYRLEPFLDLSLPIAEDKPSRAGKTAQGGGAAAEHDGGEYVLKRPDNGCRASKHSVKKERRAARRRGKLHQPAPPPAPDGDPAQAADSTASEPGASDADEEDNGDGDDLVIGSLLSDLDQPSSPAPPGPADYCRQNSDGELGSPVAADGSPVVVDGIPVAVDGSPVAADGSRVGLEGSRVTAAGRAVTRDGSSVPVDGCALDGSPVPVDGCAVAVDVLPVPVDGCTKTLDCCPEAGERAGGGDVPLIGGSVTAQIVSAADRESRPSVAGDSATQGATVSHGQSGLSHAQTCGTSTGEKAETVGTAGEVTAGGGGEEATIVGTAEEDAIVGTGEEAEAATAGAGEEPTIVRTDEEAEVATGGAGEEPAIDSTGEEPSFGAEEAAFVHVGEEAAIGAAGKEAATVGAGEEATIVGVGEEVTTGMTGEEASTVGAREEAATGAVWEEVATCDAMEDTSVRSVEKAATVDNGEEAATGGVSGEAATVDNGEEAASGAIGEEAITVSTREDAMPTVGSAEKAATGGTGEEAIVDNQTLNDTNSAACPSNSEVPAVPLSEVLARALRPLSARPHAAADECSILTCLGQFTAPELLYGSNKFGCETCTRLQRDRLPPGESGKTVYSPAAKQLLIYSPPPVLTVHLKRFEVCGSGLRKINRHVHFEERLDLAPFCSSICQDLPQVGSGRQRLLYLLTGVVAHSGRLTGGHYVAYMRVRRRRRPVSAAFLTDSVTDVTRPPGPRPADRAQGRLGSDGPPGPWPADRPDPGSDRPTQPDHPRPEQPQPEQSDRLQPKQSDHPEPEQPDHPKPEQPDHPEPEQPDHPQPEQSDHPQREQSDHPEPEDPEEPGRWYFASDTRVTEVSLETVLSKQAYLLFYERIA